MTLYAPTPPAPRSLWREGVAYVGLVAMWLGLVTIVLAAVIPLLSRTAPMQVGAIFLIPAIMADLGSIRIHLRARRFSHGALLLDAFVKLVAIFFAISIITFGGPRRDPLTPSPLDVLVFPSLLASPVLTLAAAILRKVGR